MATFITYTDDDDNVTRYRVRWNYRPKNIDGKPCDERDFAPSREKEARAFHASLEASPSAPRGGRRVMDIMTAYLASDEYAAHELRTRNDIETCIRKHIIPGLGAIEHSRIEPAMVKKFLKDLTLTGFAHLSKPDDSIADPKARRAAQKARTARRVAVPTANKVLRWSKAIMRWARVEGLTKSYAFDEVKTLPDRRPKAERRKPPRAYSDDEKLVLLEACETLQERTVLEVDWDSGMRRGELFAFHWEQALWGTQEIHVDRALDVDGSVKDVKTHEDRVVSVLDDGWAALQRWAVHIADARGVPIAELTGFVFHTDDDRPLDAVWEARHAGQYVKRRPVDRPGTKSAEEVLVLTDGIRRRSGIHLELGHCRDTYAAELLATPGVGAEELKFAMGHETVETTLRHYAVWLAGRRSQIASLVASARAARRALANA